MKPAFLIPLATAGAIVAPFTLGALLMKGASSIPTSPERKTVIEKQIELAKANTLTEAQYDAKAKLKEDGWNEIKPGIYGRWCTNSCSTTGVIGRQTYWLMEVWAKDRSASNIYAQANILERGTVIGWTNDTLHLPKGQKGVLTFGKYLPSGEYTLEMTKFSIY